MSSVEGKYSRIAILLHWLTVLLVFALFAIGWYMVDLPKGPARGETFALHKSLGLTVFLLTVWRICWRVTHPAPALPKAVSRWRATLAHGVHATFYVLLIGQPLSGYLSSSFSGYDTKFFAIPLPTWGHHDPPLNEFLTEIHVIGSVALVALVILHVLGALTHLMEPGDRLMRRMLPW